MPLCKWSQNGTCTFYRWKSGKPLKCPARTKTACMGLIDELEEIPSKPLDKIPAICYTASYKQDDEQCSPKER